MLASPTIQRVIMDSPRWFVAYSDWRGRYFVVSLPHPRWLYIFDHLEAEGGCALQSQAFQSLAVGIPSKEIYSAELVDEAYSVMKGVVSWFEPLPICNAPESIAPIPPWLFGTSPETFEKKNTLLGLRIFRNAHAIAVLSFDEGGFLEDIEASDPQLTIEAEEAFQIWAGSLNDPASGRFLP